MRISLYRKRFIIALFTLMMVGGLVFLVFRYRSLVAVPPRSVDEFGSFKIGIPLPWGSGNRTIYASPYDVIPKSIFYVFIAQRDLWCISVECGLNAALAETMGGYVEVRDIEMPGEKGAEFGFDDEHIRKKYNSVFIIGDAHGTIAGIYPNKDVDDLIPILKLHPDLANFELLNGVDEFGPLKVGDLSPLRPGDPTGYEEGKSYPYPFAHIPAGKKFYVFAFSKELLERGYCTFVGCLSHGFFDHVEELGGWFSSDGTKETARKFGLDPERVAKGEVSLVAVTNPNGIIVAIHPGKSIQDILSILYQLPNLADLKVIYPET